MNKPSLKQLIRTAKKNLAALAAVMAARDIVWRREWDASADPFAAVVQHQTSEKHAERAVVIAPWLAAQATLRDLESQVKPV